MSRNPAESSDSASTDDNATASGRVNRRRVLQSGAVVVGGTTLAGCLGDDGGGGDSDGSGDGSDGMDDGSGDGSGSDGTGGGGGETTNIAVISSPAGFNDQAFNTLSVNGLEAAAEEYNIDLQKVEETSPANYESTQADLASSGDYDLIVLVGYQHTTALEVNASEYPDQNWLLINDHVDQPNVAGRTWANHHMSFLAGVAAGTMTTTEFSYDGSSTDPSSAHIGFVGGVDGPLIQAFERSYIAGAEWVTPDVEVSIGYIGNYTDTATANDIATSQFDDGADIVYGAASAATEGIFPPAQEAGRFNIGVDADQSVTLPEYADVIMGSAVKYLNVGTRNVAVAVAQDNWESVNGQRVLGLEEEAVAFVPGQEVGPELPDIVSENIEEATQAILDGDIEVPCTAGGCN